MRRCRGSIILLRLVPVTPQSIPHSHIHPNIHGYSHPYIYLYTNRYSNQYASSPHQHSNPEPHRNGAR
jgi:hypothetical protein